jgi:hypothetical protein
MDGVYTHTVAYERDAACPICAAPAPFETHSRHTLQQARAPGPPALTIITAALHACHNMRAWEERVDERFWQDRLGEARRQASLLLTRVAKLGAGDGGAHGR